MARSSKKSGKSVAKAPDRKPNRGAHKKSPNKASPKPSVRAEKSRVNAALEAAANELSQPRARAKVVSAKVAYQRVFTFEKARAIAAALEADSSLSIEAAALDQAVSPATVRKALQRFRAGESSDEEEAIVAPVARAIETQCERLLDTGNILAIKGKPTTSWFQWQLETKHPLAYGRRQSVALTDPDGKPLGTGVSLSELARLAAEP